MILVACVDDGGGLLFHNRRQSQDRIVRENILRDAADTKLWMNAYSYRQFCGMETESIFVAEDFMNRAGSEEYALLEMAGAAAYKERIERIVLYRWNRRYPSDVLFDIPLTEHGWKAIYREEFSGSSHRKITKEVYQR